MAHDFGTGPRRKTPDGATSGRAYSSAAEAHADLKRRVLDLRLLPGWPLDGEELAMDLGVSRVAVREALEGLCRDRLVERDDAGAYRVTTVTVEGARDLLALRELVETEAVSLAAATRIDAGTAARLRQLSRATVEVDGDGNARCSIQANTAFHVALARAGGNRLLAEVLERTLAESERLFNMAVPPAAIGADTLMEHGALLDAVLAGEVEWARSICIEHASDSRRMVFDTLTWCAGLVGPQS